MDSASIAEAVWPELAELKGTHFHDTLMARRVAHVRQRGRQPLRQPDVRLLQHILFGCARTPRRRRKEATRKKAEATLTQVRKGADFAVLASQLSEDPGSKADSGFLPPSPRGRFVPAFDSAAWALEPGADQRRGRDAVRLPHHPAAAAAARCASASTTTCSSGPGPRWTRRSWTAWPGAARSRSMDERGRHDARALGAPEESRRSRQTIATYKGGELTVQEFLRWVRALPPQYLAAAQGGGRQHAAAQFARVLTQNTLLLTRGRRRRASGPTELEWKGLEQRYLAQLDTLKTEMDLSAADLTDSTAFAARAGEGRRAQDGAVLRQADRREERGCGRCRRRWRRLLRERLPYRVNDAGVGRAVDMAKEAKAKADSAAGRGRCVARRVAADSGAAPAGGPPGSRPGAGSAHRAPGGQPRRAQRGMQTLAARSRRPAVRLAAAAGTDRGQAVNRAVADTTAAAAARPSRSPRWTARRAARPPRRSGQRPAC